MHEPQPLRLYADKTMRAKHSHIPLLYPFWGLQVKDTQPFIKAAFVKHGWDPTYFTMVEKLGDAECIVLPHEYWWMNVHRADLLKDYITLSQKYQVPLLIDALGDAAGKVQVPRAHIMRNNQYRFLLDPQEITTPYAVEDLLESYCGGVHVPRQKNGIPSVGFIGFTGLRGLQRVRTITKELPLRLHTMFDHRYITLWGGRFWREWIMGSFISSPRIVANFLERSSYSGHTQTVVGDMQKNRLEFVHNLLDSDYALVVRGDANASQRFYEALSLGRIPVFIDTECVLPLEQQLDYRKFCVIIDYKDLKRAPDILADFHAGLSPEEFICMQQRAREAYERHLRIDSFSRHLPSLVRGAQQT
jgi:hypothetical protein